MKLLFYLWEIVIVTINWKQDIVSYSSVCNHTRDWQITSRSSDFVNYSNDFRPNWTPLSSITFTNYKTLKLDTHVIALRLRGRWAYGEPIATENFVLDTIRIKRYDNTSF